MLRYLTLFAGLCLAIAAAPPAQAQTKIVFGTDWLAEAEHGGFYQALALGLYKKHGLDVTIRMGGPQTNPNQQIATGVVDFQLSSGSYGAMFMVQQGIPVQAVAAYFQKDPFVLVSHAGEGEDTLEQMKGKPIMVSGQTRSGAWLFLKAKYGYTDDQIRPYNFSLAPFLADKSAIVQGFATSEPYQAEKSGVKPVVNLLADHGYDSYSAVILAQTRMIAQHPDIVRAFVEASTEGWKSYLADPAPGNALIRQDNPDIPQDVLDHSVQAMRDYGIVDSGDAKTLGLGAMTDARWQGFFDQMSAAGLYPKDMDYKKAYTLQFVDQKYGLAP